MLSLLDFLMKYKEEIPLTILLLIVFGYCIRLIFITVNDNYKKQNNNLNKDNTKMDYIKEKQDKIDTCIQDLKITLTMINKDIEEIKKISDYHDKTQNEKITELTTKMSRIYDDFDDIMEMVKQILIKNNKI